MLTNYLWIAEVGYTNGRSQLDAELLDLQNWLTDLMNTHKEKSQWIWEGLDTTMIYEITKEDEYSYAIYSEIGYKANKQSYPSYCSICWGEITTDQKSKKQTMM